MEPEYVKPEGLGPAGDAFWEKVTHEYGLNPAEERSLVDACREIDLIERLQAKVDVEALSSPLGMNPALSELRLHRGILDRLMKSIGIDTNANASPSAMGRSLASHRWAKRAQ